MVVLGEFDDRLVLEEVPDDDRVGLGKLVGDKAGLIVKLGDAARESVF